MKDMMDNFYANGKKGLATRTFISVLAFIIVAYSLSKNWSWYKNDLSDDGVRPEWASEYVNVIIWTIWYLTFGWLWTYHLKHYKNPKNIGTMYLAILALTFLYQVFLFERRTFTFAKWVSTLTLLMFLYLAYDAYAHGLFMVVFAMIIHVLITLWTTVQLWYSDSKMSGQSSCSSSSASEYSHPWSKYPGYKHWYKPKSHGGSSSSSSLKWW